MPIVFLALAAIGSGGAAIATGSPASRPDGANSHHGAIFTERAAPPRT